MQPKARLNWTVHSIHKMPIVSTLPGVTSVFDNLIFKESYHPLLLLANLCELKFQKQSYLDTLCKLELFSVNIFSWNHRPL